ncbi:hypothetical protein FIU87_18700 [Bacillus sp. THAF10]|uniref:acyltransferase family protein n=1 Tax=Bacillus sp. THAF10 TaxID=2587848 RepID=UPI001269653C|nr:heparan-alpha-glucosaminide N-acetyltransferase domain-containing protein [Bacillus sp. THAF10]QFT90678.1 hypothetical protein FIU87_18700 [Bacillus sp. THAF10]
MMRKSTIVQSKRYRSIDVTRGIVVLLAVFVSALPGGGYEYFRHAYWYGVTITDLIFPAFLTLYGLGLSIAYRRGVNWKGLFRRTVLLLVYGLLFNFVAAWSFDFDTLRFTGVLQLFAITGLVVVVISRTFRNWKWPIAVGIGIAIVYTAFLVVSSAHCEGGVPRTSCNYSGIVDSFVFGENHMYADGERGFDPEGIFSIISALSNVLFGYAIGMVILSRKHIKRTLLTSAAGLMVLAFVLQQFIDFNKRLWSPSFALLASSITFFLLVMLFYLIDEKRNHSKPWKAMIWYVESFGRNSLLIYFGKMVVFIIFANLTISILGLEGTLRDLFFRFLSESISYPHLFYSLFFVCMWSFVAVILHWKKKYIRV